VFYVVDLRKNCVNKRRGAGVSYRQNKKVVPWRHVARGVLGAAVLCGFAIAASSMAVAKSDGQKSFATAASASSGVAHTKSVVRSLMRTTKTYPAPGPSLNVKRLKGKTVWYIPITFEDPEFATTATALKAAMAKAGMHLHTCNGAASPSATAACLNRATSTRAAGVILDSIPVVLAANAVAAVEKAGIPVLITDQIVPPTALHLPGTVSGLGNDKLSYLIGDGPISLRGISDWIIADSGGNANVLISEFTDNYSATSFVETGAKAEFQKYCGACKVTTSLVTNANFALIPSETSAALISNPTTNYVLSEFDASLQVVYGGVQSAGYTKKVRGASTVGILAGLQMIKTNNYLAADLGTDFPYQGWADADQIFRMILHKPIVSETIPQRLFTSANIGTVKLTPAAETTGEWYGSLAYKKMFATLWGVA
jgi:ribose transport system substrate-binding protein